MQSLSDSAFAVSYFISLLFKCKLFPPIRQELTCFVFFSSVVNFLLAIYCCTKFIFLYSDFQLKCRYMLNSLIGTAIDYGYWGFHARFGRHWDAVRNRNEC